MDSPFPGMDPYIERFWNDVHGTLITYIRDALNELLPARFRATLQARVVIAVGDVRYPDVAVTQRATREDDDRGGGTATAAVPRAGLAAEPVLIRYRAEPRKEYSVEVRDTKTGETVVTAIEVLSPDNKRPGNGMDQFRAKQVEYDEGGVNRVEIDLLRRGLRLFDFDEEQLEPRLRKPYYVTVYRADRPGECKVYAIDLRSSLPAVGVPLRAGDADIALDLQPLMGRVYRNGRFPVDYGQPCDPPLEGADAEWAAQLLRGVPAAPEPGQRPVA